MGGAFGQGQVGQEAGDGKRGVETSPLSLKTPRLGGQETGSQAQCFGVVSGGPPDLPGCLPSSTAAAERTFCPGGEKIQEG